MIDIRTWEALRSQALAAHECTAAVSGMLAAYLKADVSALLE
jgi:hypothetical protein